MGAIVGVIGPNGSGKTTLLEMMLGLLPVASGTLTVLGEPPLRGNPRIGYVPQNYTAEIGESIRCRDLVTLGRTGTRWGLGGRSGADRASVDAALAAVSAQGFADRRLNKIQHDSAANRNDDCDNASSDKIFHDQPPARDNLRHPLIAAIIVLPQIISRG